LGGQGVSTGNIAIVGEFPTFKHGGTGGVATDVTPLTFSSSRAVSDYKTDLVLNTISKLAFAPSTDSRVAGGASSLTFVNVVPNTAASSSGFVGLKTSAGNDCLNITSRKWGTSGNRVLVNMVQNATDSAGTDFTISHEGTSETFSNLQSGAVAELIYDGGELTTSSTTVGLSQWLWTWTKNLVFPATSANTSGTASEPTKIVVEGNTQLGVKVTNGGAGASSAAIVVVIAGLDENGAAQSVTWTTGVGNTNFGSGVDTRHLSTEKWSRLDSITYSTADNTYNGTVEVYGVAFDLTTSSFTSVGAMVTHINNNSTQGFKATAKSVKINKIPATPSTTSATLSGGVDAQSAVNTLSPAKCTVRADLWYIVEELNTSNLVTCARVSAATADLPPNDTSTAVQTYLYGGTEASATADSWDSAYQAIQASDIQIVVPFTDTIGYLQAGVTHCKAAAVSGYERNMWCGASAGNTLATLFSSYTSVLNSRLASLVGQKIYISNSEGLSDWHDPIYLAVMMAGMQAGTPVATPLTWKRPSVLNVESEWLPVLDDDDMISKGICGLSRDNLGWKIERSVTTYMEDDNPIYSETSAMESANTSVRMLRAALIGKIGTAVTDGTANRIKSTVTAELDNQVKDGIIKNYQNVVLEDLGDKISIVYELAAVEPLNFITITANVIRIAS
jgi:hypothetical protein